MNNLLKKGIIIFLSMAKKFILPALIFLLVFSFILKAEKTEARTSWQEPCGAATKGGCVCSKLTFWACAGTPQCSYTCPSYTNTNVSNNCSFTHPGDCSPDMECSSPPDCREGFTCSAVAGSNCSYSCPTDWADNDNNGSCETYTAPCTRGNPTIVEPVNNKTGVPPNPLSYTMTVTNTDSVGCGPSNFNMVVTTACPVGWNCNVVPLTINNIAPGGGTGDAVLTMTPPVGASTTLARYHAVNNSSLINTIAITSTYTVVTAGWPHVTMSPLPAGITVSTPFSVTLNYSHDPSPTPNGGIMLRWLTNEFDIQLPLPANCVKVNEGPLWLTWEGVECDPVIPGVPTTLTLMPLVAVNTNIYFRAWDWIYQACATGTDVGRDLSSGTCGLNCNSWRSVPSTADDWELCDANPQPVTVNPAAVPYTLTITKDGTGTGTVTSNPAGIDCGVNCGFSFASGALVTLTANGLGGSTFAGWSGGGCSGTGTCPITISADTTVKATFNPAAAGFDFSLTDPSPSTDSFLPGGGTSTTIDINKTSGTPQQVTLSATNPDPANILAHWLLNNCSPNPKCSPVLIINTLGTIVPDTYTINITGVGGGQTHNTSTPFTFTVIPKACGVAFTTSPYVRGQTMHIKYIDAPLPFSDLDLYKPSDSLSPVKHWSVSGSGEVTYDLQSTDEVGQWKVMLVGGTTCLVQDQADVQPGCLAKDPKVEFLPPQKQSTTAGTILTFDFRVFNDDTTDCIAHRFYIIPDTCPLGTGWKCSANLVVTSPIDPQTWSTQSLNYRVTSPSDADPDDYIVTVRVETRDSAGLPLTTGISDEATYTISACTALSDRALAAKDKKCFEPGYDPIADVNSPKDGVVDNTDIGLINACGGAEACCKLLWSTADPCSWCNDIFNPDAPVNSRIEAALNTKCFDPGYDPIADTTKDGIVDLFDIVKTTKCGGDETCCQNIWSITDPCLYCQELTNRFTAAYGKECFQSGYDPVADTTKDGIVDIFDSTRINKCIPDEACCKNIWNSTDICKHCNLLLINVNKALGNECFEFGYTPIADINKDRVVDSSDQTAVTACAGAEACCQGLEDPIDPCGTPSPFRGLVRNPLQAKNIVEFIEILVDLLFNLALIFAPITALIGGLYLLASGGDPEKVRRAKQILFYLAIGVGVILFARGIIELIKRIVVGA